MFQFWVFGIVVNLFLFLSVFDIYFKSPVVQVETVHSGKIKTGVKRVVFIVGDGLRADIFFDNPEIRPFLSTKMKEDFKSVWGIADTRVPTESRPGHVALFAGFYEDPSAVFTGWKQNLVEFDSIFNRTQSSVLLGSPDIVKMFANKDANIFIESYPPDWQDFSKSNSSNLDLWVLNKFTNMSKHGNLPREDKSLIFLHLLGIDNTGHAKKPRSAEYKSNVQVVDTIVKQVEKIIQQYYMDHDTLYIFASDHGMTDWGSHGSGSKDETETPFIIWGRGIREHKKLRLNQADFTALLAGALQVPYPTNSRGVFPHEIWDNNKFAINAFLANFFQLNELKEKKKELISRERNFAITDFDGEKDIERELQNTNVLKDSKRYTYAMERLQMGTEHILNGIVYYERYDQNLLKFFSVSCFLAWMFLINELVFTFESHVLFTFIDLSSLRNAVIGSLIITKGLIGWSLWKTPYTFLPLYLLGVSFQNSSEKEEKSSDSKVEKGIGLKMLVLLFALSFIGIEILINSFYERTALVLGLGLCALWFLRGKESNIWQKIISLGAVALLGIFPLAPVIGKSQNFLYMTLGPLISTGVILSLMLKFPFSSLPKKDRTVLLLQCVILLSVSILLHFPSSIITRIVAWSSIPLSFSAPALTSSSAPVLRLMSIYLAICVPFCFLSFSYETLFFPLLFFVLLLFLKSELAEQNQNPMTWREFLQLNLHDGQDRSSTCTNMKSDIPTSFRRAWFHLFFVFLSFFGTGNIASVNSFDPSSVRCFVTVFNPFVMMLVLLEKIVGPLLLVSCVFRVLLSSSCSRSQVERNFLIVLLFCQGMALHTFFHVQNEGSWLEIGTSISHYVIVQCTTLILFLLHFCAHFLISFSFFPESIECLRNPSSTHAHIKLM